MMRIMGEEVEEEEEKEEEKGDIDDCRPDTYRRPMHCLKCYCCSCMLRLCLQI